MLKIVFIQIIKKKDDKKMNFKLNIKTLNKKIIAKTTILISIVLISSISIVFLRPSLKTLSKNTNIFDDDFIQDIEVAANSESGYSIGIKHCSIVSGFVAARVIWLNLDEFFSQLFKEGSEKSIKYISEQIITALAVTIGVTIPPLILPAILLAIGCIISMVISNHMTARGGHDIKIGIGIQQAPFPFLYFYMDHSRNSIDNYDFTWPIYEPITFWGAYAIASAMALVIPENSWVGI